MQIKIERVKRKLEIDVFFRFVDWNKLVEKWDLYPRRNYHNYINMVETLKRKQNSIQKVWKQNLNMTLPKLLDAMGLLQIQYQKRLNSNNSWYFANISDIMYLMGIPKTWYSMNRVKIFDRYYYWAKT